MTIFCLIIHTHTHRMNLQILSSTYFQQFLDKNFKQFPIICTAGTKHVSQLKEQLHLPKCSKLCHTIKTYNVDCMSRSHKVYVQVCLLAGHPVCMHLCTETRCTQLQHVFQNASPYTKIMVLSLDPVNSIQ